MRKGHGMATRALIDDPACMACGQPRSEHGDEPPYDRPGDDEDYCGGFTYVEARHGDKDSK